MSGHSKWAGIKHKKAIVDARRGKLFAKLIRMIEVAAREGGGNPDGNATLADAISRARDASLPMDTIQRAIKRGTGELQGVSYETLVYEGYGPGGVAILIEMLTDNRNRAAAEVRKIFTRNGGTLGDPGSVAWMFEKRGALSVPKEKVSEEELLQIALESGGEDLVEEGDAWRVTCQPNDLSRLRAAVEEAGLEIQHSELYMQPMNTIPVEGEAARKVLKLLDDLEESDDVQEVFSNFDIADDVLAEASG